MMNPWTDVTLSYGPVVDEPMNRFTPRDSETRFVHLRPRARNLSTGDGHNEIPNSLIKAQYETRNAIRDEVRA